MRALRWLIFLCVAAALLAAGQSGSHAEYLGGTRSDIPASSSGDIRLTDRALLRLRLEAGRSEGSV